MMPPPRFPGVPFTWAQAKARGVSRHRLDQAVENREVRRVLVGVYVRFDVRDNNLTRAQAAALVVNPFVVVCDRTAAWLHGVDTFDHRELEILPPLETYVLRGHTPTSRSECFAGTRDLQPIDLCQVEDLTVTTPLRTALDLGCKLHRRDALAAIDGFMRVHQITHGDLRGQLPRYYRRRGVVQLRELAAIADPRAESPGESWTRLAIIDAGLPVPQPQYWIDDEYGQPVFRVDLAYPRSRVIVEYDGVEFHTSPEQRQHDENRRQWLRDRGWTVIVVDKTCFDAEALERWTDEVRAALGLGLLAR